MTRIAYLPTLILTLLAACTPEIPENQEFIKTSGVFVLNEGNFTYGNASLSFIDVETNTIENQVFFRANGFPLGDVAQSMTIKASTGFIVVNNSGKVLVINTKTFTHQATITGLTSPRYLEIINESKAYITDLYAHEITIIDPNDYTITGTINTGCSTEQMIRWSDFILVLNWSYGDQILKIDTGSDEVIDSLKVTLQPNSMILDQEDRLWVLSDGGYAGSSTGNEIPALTIIDPSSLEIIQEFQFPGLDYSPNHLCTNYTRDTLYFLTTGWAGELTLNTGIYRMSIEDEQLPDQAWIPQGDRHFYAMGIDPGSSCVYVSDPKDYLQKGMVYRYSSSGILIDSLQADRLPGFFAFSGE